MSTSSVLFVPLYLWNLYVEHLWNYKPGTWVYRIASTAWILAFLILTPFVFLTLLDVASYVIARTLGVIDATKASTGDMPVPAQEHTGDVTLDGQGVPSIHVAYATPSASTSSLNEISTPSYLRDNVVEEGNFKLAGVDSFSPAPSQPSSPTLSRRSSYGSTGHFSLQPMTDLSGRVGRTRSDSETSGDAARGGDEVHMRRRGRERGSEKGE
ncbi:hypothetical protein BDW22DRAFT_1429644 [Trametopsis cervina]|nr:hypothetical protein BDW22DRAFT_1429644 [Trametopsis cervina]